MKNNIFKTIMFATLMLFAMSFTSFAATEKITNINISIDETKQEAGVIWKVEPTTNSSDYSISETSWSTDYDNWSPGKKITLTVVVSSTDKVFDKNASIWISNGEKSKATKVNAHEYKIYINYIPKVVLTAPTSIYYDDEYIAKWDKVDYAGGYEVEIKKDGNYNRTVNIEGRANNYIDLSEYATDDEEFTIKVKAVGASDKRSYVMDSDWTDFEDGYSSNASSTAFGQFNGSSNYKTFTDTDGNQVSGWQFINNTWYYFDPANNNCASTNKWMYINNHWYLFDTNGKMMTGWQKRNNYWYYLNPDLTNQYAGAMLTGWVKTAPNSPWYYLNNGMVKNIPDGAMLADTTTPDGYHVNSNGEWIQ